MCVPILPQNADVLPHIRRPTLVATAANHVNGNDVRRSRTRSKYPRRVDRYECARWYARECDVVTTYSQYVHIATNTNVKTTTAIASI